MKNINIGRKKLDRRDKSQKMDQLEATEVKETGDNEKGKKGFKNTKIYDFFWLMNPKNLATEVHVYGYNFSWQTHALLFLCGIMGIGVVGLIFQLQYNLLIICMIVMMFLIPTAVRYTYRQMYEQKRFADVTTYMEQMLYSFEVNKKVLAALKETQETFEEGKMRDCIDRAIAYIEAGVSNSENGILREGLSFIEEQYGCTKLLSVHELLVNSEDYGGNTDKSIFLLRHDVEEWKRRGYMLQERKKAANTDNILSIIVATAICAVTLYVLNYTGSKFPNGEEFNLFKNPVIQVTSFIYILLMMFAFMRSMRGQAQSWLNEEAIIDNKMVASSYKTVMNYNEEKERRKSVVIAIPFAVMSGVAFVYQLNWLGIIGFLVIIFTLRQYKIGYNIASNDVRNALYICMPQWFMQLALLLQHNNVAVSIAKSVESAPPVLKPELQMLLARLSEAPGQLSSYTDFCRKFDVPEVQSCMKMLHTISEAGVGNSDEQINDLITRVNEMQDQADKIQNNKIEYKMKTIFGVPVLASSAKMFVDFCIGVMVMFAMLQNMGGAI
jgi:hypothetical protein